MDKVIDRGNMCLHCRKDTSFGSGRFVNRHPANIYNMELGVEEDGYCCDECEQEYYRDNPCLLYTSPSPRDRTRSRMPSSA